MAGKKKAVDYSIYERRFERGGYFTSERWGDMCERHRESVAEFVEWNNNLCKLPRKPQRSALPPEEYRWLAQHHPECIGAYDRKLKPYEAVLIRMISIGIPLAFLGGLGYLVYKSLQNR